MSVAPSLQSPHAAPAMSAATFQRALVIGASSGMGAELVRQLVGGGARVAAIARRSALLDELRAELDRAGAGAGARLFVHAHDVRDYAAVPALFERIVKELGGLDLVIYAAGVMPKI